MADQDQVQYKVDFEKKRPKKSDTVTYFKNNFAAYTAGVPGATLQNISNQTGFGNYYLYESEVRELLEAMPEKDRKPFVEFLKPQKCVKAGEPAPFGGKGGGRGEGSTTIDTPERAAEVANTPADVPIIVDIMKQMLELRKLVNPHINLKAECSIALKNKKDKKSKKGAEDAGNDNTAGQSDEVPTLGAAASL